MNSKPHAIFQSGGPMIAMVALNAPSLPAMDAVSRSLAASWSEGPEMANISVQDGAATFELGGELACAGLMPVPIPWGDLEAPSPLLCGRILNGPSGKRIHNLWEP